jgi:MarR family transcriptional regulator, lower aerobic nicotinate degradation pathway regulator
VTKPDLGLIDGLFQLSFLLHSRLLRIASAHELSIIQVRLLGILRDREPGMLELARYLELEKSSLSGLIDRAESRGLVERRPSADDRRATTVRITALGRQLSRAMVEEVGKDVAALVGVLSEKDRARLTSLVERVVLQSGQTLDERS